MEDLYAYVNPKNRKHCPIVSLETLEIVRKHSQVRINLGLFLDGLLVYMNFFRDSILRLYLIAISIINTLDLR